MYRRLTKGLNSVGKLIPENADIYKLIDLNKDYYLSVYKYNEEQKKKAEQKTTKETVDQKTGEVKEYIRDVGVEGIEDVVTNLLIFDFDSSNNIKEAQIDTIECVNRLVAAGFPIDSINLAFSGGKGFSIVIVHDKDLTPSEHKTLAKNLANGLKTFDPKNYNASRVFRINHTKHNKTGLYKTPLTFEELKNMSLEDIKELAKNEYEPVQLKEAKFPESLLFQLKYEKPQDANHNNPEIKEGEPAYRLDFSKKPYYLTDVKYALHKGFIPPGKSNEGMMILAATYKHVGFDKIDAYHMLKAVNEKRSEIYGVDKKPNDDIWKEVIEVVYSPSWKGGTYSISENELLQNVAQQFNITENSKMESFGGIMDDFFDFAANINDNVIKTGIKSLDESLLITTGMMVGVLGAPSAGKTSLVTSIIEKNARDGYKPLFESLDMYKHLMSMRLIQRQSGISAEKKLRKSIKGDPTYDPNYNIANDSDIIKAVDELSKIYGNVQFNFTRGATIESIEEDIKVNKATHGDKFKLVVIDYLEKVRGPYSDATANSGYVASRLSDLASTYDVCILLLLQPQKSAGDPSEELLSMRKVKGASVIEQDCRVVLTMWRPGFSPRDATHDRFASVAIVKNNMGEVKTLDYSWNGLKGELKELTNLERDQLEALREELRNAKAAERAEGNGWDI